MTYHDVIDRYDYLSKFNASLASLKFCIKDISPYLPLRYEFSRILCFTAYTMVLLEYLKSMKQTFGLSYMGDGNHFDSFSMDFIRLPCIEKNLFDEVVWLNCNMKFQRFYNYLIKLRVLIAQSLPVYQKIKWYFLKKIYRVDLKYDNKQFSAFYTRLKPHTLTQPKYDPEEFKKFIDEIDKCLDHDMPKIIKSWCDNLLIDLNKALQEINQSQKIKITAFTFLAGVKSYALKLLYNNNNIPVLITQHGSYVHENEALLSNEVLSADVNFVFNDYTKNLFLAHGAKNVKVIYSYDFNYEVLSRKYYKYDFLYITYCSVYIHTGAIDPIVNLDNIADSLAMYERHQNIIKLFGTSFPNLKICVKVLPYFIDNGLHIPLKEIAKQYKNVKIEYIKPIKKLINLSRNIISDYFSSDFINYDLHLKKDIILFSHSPFPLKLDDLEKLSKMFILCKDEMQLEDILSNFKEITRNRVRHLDIIEYFSSKLKENCEDAKVALKEAYTNVDLDI
ncbi:hypothetical protein L3V86_07010 [Thiotrichales bacterium 19S11-10]|nr:hypothetical protein [Thiotrichales bacterium 19S11-10]